MSERCFRTKEIYNKGRDLWRIVFALAVLVVLTAALATVSMRPFFYHADYEIDLYKGRTEIRTAAARSTAEEFTGKGMKIFDFRVSDSKRTWSTSTPIELFRAADRNTKGKTTVRSAESDNVVAPGTNGKYTFTLKNASDLDSSYKVWLEADAGIGSLGIPVEFCMAGSRGWVSGSQKWLRAEELNKIMEKSHLRSGRSTQYTLYWRWAFERGEDEQDTFFGNLAAGQRKVWTEKQNISEPVSCRVAIHTIAEAESEKDSQNTEAVFTQPTAKNTGNISKKAPETGDSTQIWKWAGVLGAAGAAAITIILDRRRKTIRKIFLAAAVLVIGGILCFTNIYTYPHSQPVMPFGIGMANVLSGSMEPTFSKGTLLIFRKTQEAARGDIVVYQSGNSLVVHRVKDIRKNQIITQGDANNAPDQPFDRTEIRGVVIGWIPYLGAILNRIRTPRGILLLLTGLSASYMTQTSVRDSAGVAKFEVTESGTLIQEIQNISIEPGETVRYEIAVTNKSETAVRYLIQAGSRKRNLPLKFEIYKKTTESGDLNNKSVSTEGTEILSDTMPAGDSAIHRYMVEITWPAGENSAYYAGKSDVFTVILKAEQLEQ